MRWWVVVGNEYGGAYGKVDSCCGVLQVVELGGEEEGCGHVGVMDKEGCAVMSIGIFPESVISGDVELLVGEGVGFCDGQDVD